MPVYDQMLMNCVNNNVYITSFRLYLRTKGSEYGPPEALADVMVSQYISDEVSFTE